MINWLTNSLAALNLPEEAEGWCLGRGLLEARIADIGIKVWDSSLLPDPAPDPEFRAQHGQRADTWDGRLVTPLYSPRQKLIGVEARTYGQGVAKWLSQYLLPEAKWNPVLVGLTKLSMQKIWCQKANLWITEGVFDMGAMEHVVPDTDVCLATLRARFSDRHASFCQRFLDPMTQTVNMVYDNDQTGRDQTFGKIIEATGKKQWGALDTLTRVGIKCQDRPYRGGKDPGEIWEKSGTDGLRKAFKL